MLIHFVKVSVWNQLKFIMNFTIKLEWMFLFVWGFLFLMMHFHSSRKSQLIHIFFFTSNSFNRICTQNVVCTLDSLRKVIYWIFFTNDLNFLLMWTQYNIAEYVADGRQEKVMFDKITSRISKLCYGLHADFVDPVSLWMM